MKEKISQSDPTQAERDHAAKLYMIGVTPKHWIIGATINFLHDPPYYVCFIFLKLFGTIVMSSCSFAKKEKEKKETIAHIQEKAKHTPALQ